MTLLTYAQIKAKISTILQDTSGVIYSTATDGEIELTIDDSLREIPRWAPYIPSDPDVFQIETRNGTATSDSSGHLVDATNAQFLATDVDKVVFNTTDKTWGIITAWTSTSDVTLNKDLFPDGNEGYMILNKGCTEITQVNIEDIVSRYDVEDGDRIEYPIGTRRNIDDVEGDILTIGIDTSILPDTNTTGVNKDVHIYFRKYHFISQLTTLTGAVNLGAGYSAGDTSMVLDTLQTSGTIMTGQPFTIAGTRGVYTVTADATISTSAATIAFYPGLENDVANDVVVTFKQSTLPASLEPLFCKYVAAKVEMGKANLPVQQAITAITTLTTASDTISAMSDRINQAIDDNVSGRTETDKAVALISTSAAAEIALMNAQIDEAKNKIIEGEFSINESNKGGPGTATDWLNSASADINVAQGYLGVARGYFEQAQQDETLSNNYGQMAARELSNANQLLNQSIGNLRQIATGLQVAGSWRILQEKAERDMAKVEDELSRIATSRTYEIYART
uniref:Uncharacterized protein n=4 Tax=viral metagenome TaxID=1070528 RepID=A0A6M3KD42_9ZZZZ